MTSPCCTAREKKKWQLQLICSYCQITTAKSHPNFAGKTGIFETEPAILAGVGYETEVAVYTGLIKPTPESAKILDEPPVLVDSERGGRALTLRNGAYLHNLEVS